MGNTVANEYKQTMNLPKTDFSMKAGLAQNEPKRLEKWESTHVYERLLEKNKDGKPFVLHDGPPYANGPIHIGHAFNKILKDIIVKNKAQQGYFAPYVPGWDCHGLPIENKVEDQLGPEKMKKVDTPTFRRICREYATKQLDGQRKGFKRLGVLGEWDNPYLTYLPEYEAGNIEIFKKLYLDGSIYRGRKPIHWCSHCHTALAEAEIEYADETSPSIYVKFFFTETPDIIATAAAEAGMADAPSAVVIWTTTPWTLPANQVVCLSPDADYVVAVVEGQLLVMAAELAGAVADIAGWGDLEFLQADGARLEFKGIALLGATYAHPVLEGEVGSILCGTHVTLDTGTGAVHTAPGHGVDDYKVCQANGIRDIKMPVDDEGKFYEGSCPWGGKGAVDSNQAIIDFLRDAGSLVAHVDIVHSYPHCWRCHEPVIFRATTQWFVSMDDTGLRDKASNAIENEVAWYPGWASNRIGAMVAERPDWCISRQRLWGVPIPVFKCETCGETVATEATFDAVINLFKTEGADAWYSKAPADFLPADTTCPHCGAGVEALASEKDVLDVWWESGVSHTSVCEARDYLRRPADIYLEGSDQHRGWFQSSLLTSVAAYGIAPYKSVISCGFTVDEQGRKMSKSLGNGIDPADVCGKFGADVLRLWVSSVDYSVDVSISENILKQVSDAYRKFRNSFRFLLANLNDFDDQVNAVTDWNALLPVDQWIMARTRDLLAEVNAAYDEYRFHNVYRAVYDFVVNDLSAVYMEAAKDRLYSYAPNDPARRSAQTAMMNILDMLVRVLSPILTFTTDEIWENYPEAMRNRAGRPDTVVLAGWPTVDDFTPAIPADTDILADFETVLEIRDAAMKVLEAARSDKTIAKSQEAALVVRAPQNVLDVATKYDTALYQEMFVVSDVAFEAGDELAVELLPAKGEKCPRCWNYRELGTSAAYPSVCAHCADALAEIGFAEAAE